MLLDFLTTLQTSSNFSSVVATEFMRVMEQFLHKQLLQAAAAFELN